MSKKKKREENLKKMVAGIIESFDKNYVEKVNEKFSGTSDCNHVWVFHNKSEDHTEIEYYCDECHNHKTEKQEQKEQYKPKLLPHEIKNHGPAEHHIDSRKYTAPAEKIQLDGDLIARNKIFDNCFQNRVIINVNITGLEEKSNVLDTIIPKIIVDECVANSTLIKKIKELGYNVWYLGRGLPDDEIFKVVKEQNAILVTEDEEFHNRVLDDLPIHDPIFIVRNTDIILENVGVIQRYMKRFEEKL